MEPAHRGSEAVAVRLQGASKTFVNDRTGEIVEALRPTDLSVAAGEFVCLVGPSGCGKTTALNMVAGLMKPTQGEVEIDGAPARQGNPDVGYLLARDALLPWRTALKNVRLPLELRGVSKKEASDQAALMLESVGLGSFCNAYPGELSHGMRQRVALARTLVTNPGYLMMDEPFSALDAETRMKLQGQFLQLWERHKSTVLFVTHDLAEAIVLGDRIVVFGAHPGRVVDEFIVNLERPRDVLELQGKKEYHELYQSIWSVLKREMSLA